MSSTIEPFEIPSIPAERLALLKQKLQNAKYPNELGKEVGWEYGAPRWVVKPLVEAWLNDYDWEKARAEMNKWHHYRVEIQNLREHFIHERSSNLDAVPLLMLNGWPSSFYEYHKVIDSLRDGANGGHAFHVVIASHAGFGFSEAPKLPGHGGSKSVLGYDDYMVHGSDFGTMVGKWLAVKHPQQCKGFHTATIALGMDTVYGRGTSKIKGRSFVDVENDPELGYCAIQSTRPYTLAYGLTDSPVGLLAWLLEKYHNWSYPENKDDSVVLPDTITTDEFLTQATLFWLTNSISSSIRFYYETFNDAGVKAVFPLYVNIPSAVSCFPADLSKVPREWLEANFNLQQYNELDMGGHFPALECGALLVDEVQRFGKFLKTMEYLK
ncbi:Alpha/Beta hydrolase protein [Zychaea mexicana]|uniref:Alpha/Beta hydrolase protein n=1 Tax=Zychaea mexicana TaxID=64656 RepID=UPI0022FE589E|nr:Alpha/Beta hydrolase protein [Zychaea mexicana]KAI9493360.1 Alpha/Beta hydrolase protein [Zychaea mexicana]